ncbi:MAG: zinc-binding alcohol dehydrogenase [Verrucomicrobia bacterium]|nr:zinc-binding alcohol dehydrogenase [Verrucomicrobiota bacterium]
MSTGTENIVFNRLFEPGTGWDNWVKYPFYPGYAVMGEVEKVGPKAAGLKVGDRVVTRHGHASHHIANVDQCFLVPAEVKSTEAAWFALAKICAMAVRAADYRIGDGILIIGAGPIGQMSVRWAFAAGLEKIVVVDSVAMRLELARRGGATATVASGIEAAAAEVKAAFGGADPALIMDTTGNENVFVHALALAGRKARVVILGDTGTPSQQRLSHAVMGKGLTIVAAHDSHEEPDWNSSRIIRLFFDLIRSRRFGLDGINTHTFAPADCAKAYETANTKRGETMGILFDWAK